MARRSAVVLAASGGQGRRSGAGIAGTARRFGWSRIEQRSEILPGFRPWRTFWTGNPRIAVQFRPSLPKPHLIAAFSNPPGNLSGQNEANGEEVETAEGEPCDEEKASRNGSTEESAEEDPISRAVHLIKDAIEKGESSASMGLRSGEEFATQTIESTRARIVENSPIKLEVNIPDGVESVLHSTSHVVKEGKRTADYTVSRVGDTAKGVTEEITKVGDRFSKSLPDLPQAVKDLPLTPELEFALNNAVSQAQRIHGETAGLAAVLASSLHKVSSEGLLATSRVATSIADSTVDVVKSSFGKDAGAIAAGGLGLAKELFNAAAAASEKKGEGPATGDKHEDDVKAADPTVESAHPSVEETNSTVEDGKLDDKI